VAYDLPSLLRIARDLRLAGREATFCLVVRARGSTPQSAGALMIVDDTAQIHGTIGGGCVEAEIRRVAHGLISTGGSSLHRLKLDHDYGWDDGLICGGTIEVAIAPPPSAEAIEKVLEDLAARRATTLTLSIGGEGNTDQGSDEPIVFDLHLPPRQRLYVAGAGHIGQALARSALRLDFDVTLFDDRAHLLGPFIPEGASAVDDDIAAALTRAPIDSHTACVIVTRGHRHDGQALGAVVGRGAGYVGMIGSRRKVKLIFDELRARGHDPASLARVHAPIGLDIGAVTVEEIAVAIVAQLIEQRSAACRPYVTERAAMPRTATSG